MKPKERQIAIIDYLQVHGKTTVDVLSDYFHTTGATIRKDLTALEEDGKVLRTYGSVVLVTNDEEICRLSIKQTSIWKAKRKSQKRQSS